MNTGFLPAPEITVHGLIEAKALQQNNGHIGRNEKPRASN